MCKCRPEVRTPFCGSIGCEWPKQTTKPTDADVMVRMAEEYAKNLEHGLVDPAKYYAFRAGWLASRRSDPVVLELVEAAQAQIDRWFRNPPVAEGGDFFAGMSILRNALNKWEQSK